MGTAFWIKRFLVVLAGAFAIISLAQALRGHAIEYSATQGAIWGVIGAAIFTLARYRQARKGQHCALCRDTPEMREE
ncbi:hypothetical protein [Duganella sp. Root1480D1]|uniref:hypothetical protein n=1 Tax=Duganella sp. Root1480D1 TaxID=1736471 RepID=UPI00070E7CD0|nr:hypothetical protein [Duganella sp. Root1480D1]KQZ45023.1 hypothetical protein ASD58_01865 [Duganella sp. Root1480D1]